MQSTKLLNRYTAQEEKVNNLNAEVYLLASQGNRERNGALRNAARKKANQAINAEKTLTKLQIECGKNYVVLNTGLSRTLDAQTIVDITDKVRKAPENIRVLWNLMSRRMKVLDTEYSGISCYDVVKKGIKFNLQKDAKANLEIFKFPSYTDMFHEIGHLVDHAMKANINYYSVIYRNGAFSEALMKETEEYIKSTSKKLGVSISEAEKVISEEISALSDAQQRDISDIFSGATKNRVFGRWKHENDYWTGGANLPRETFANMFQATINNPESLAQIKKYFPKSYKIFEEMIDEYIEGIK